MKKYEQLGTAGEGAYGVVLKCKHRDTGDLVAIKKFREPDEDDAESKRLTQREVKILRAVSHENIVRLREAFRQKGILYLVFEYVEKNLMDVLEASPGGVGTEEARRLTGALARALEHCHHRHVVHRDIKPENILIYPADNSLRLCDFGSACKLGSDAVLTDYVSTRWYRAPELLVRSNDYDASVDIWALGCVMAECSVGKPLFPSRTDLEALSLIQTSLGQLTPIQSKRCMELTDFGKFKFPLVGEPETLRKRLGSAMTEQQMQLLEQVVVIDPPRRLTARGVLSAPWLADLQAATTDASPRRPTEVAPANDRPSARPPRPESGHSDLLTQIPYSSRGFAQAAKPRVQRSVSPFFRQAQPSNGYLQPAAAVAKAVVSELSREPSPAVGGSGAKAREDGLTVAARSRQSPPIDPLEASIEEDIEQQQDDLFAPPMSVHVDMQDGYRAAPITLSTPPLSGLKKCVRPVGDKSTRGSSLTRMGA